MASRLRQVRFCRCGAVLARDNTGVLCASCARVCRDRLIAPPEVCAGFWSTEALRAAFAARHMGRISRAYRMHPAHRAAYGADGISQTLLGQWLGLRQPQVSKLENGPPLQHLDTLQHWARVLRIPPELLWFALPDHEPPRTPSDPAHAQPTNDEQNGATSPSPQRPAPVTTPGVAPGDQAGHDTEGDPVLVAPWNHQGTVEAAVLLKGGGRVKRRVFLTLTGPALTAPAHQWLVHEPEPLLSALSGRRISERLVDQFTPMIAELRAMDDVGGGGSVLDLAEQHFGWVAGLLDQASYDEPTGRRLLSALAELGQFCGWTAYDAGDFGLAQRYYVTGLRAAHTADNRLFGAHILSFMAKGAARQGQPAAGVTFIETALAGTRGQATPAVLAELHIQQAFAFAALGETSACHAAINHARTQVERLEADNDPPWLYWMDYAAVNVRSGDALLELGQADKAVDLLSEGVAQFSEPFVRDRQIYLTYLADARARPGKQRDLDAAAGLGMQALDLAESLDSHRGTDRLCDLYRRLKPHAKVQAVHDFLDRARTFIQKN